MLDSIERFIKTLEEQKILYCHWKSNEHLADAMEGDTDLDLLFDPSQRTEVEMVFNKCGLKRFRATPLMQYNAIEDYIGFDQKAAKIWHVHTHYRLTLGENHLKGYTVSFWGKKVLNNRIRVKGIWTASPSDELVLLLCRIALKLRWRDMPRSLSRDDLVELSWLKKRVTERSLRDSASDLLGNNSKKLIIKLYKSEIKMKAQFRELQGALRKELKYYTAYNRVSSWATRTKREIFWLYGGAKRKLGKSSYCASRRISPSGGLVVAILGCDGAGKSTTLSYIKKEFNKKLDVASIYFGSGDGSCSIIRKPMKLIAKRVGGRGVGHVVEREYKEKKKISIKSRIYSMAKILWAVALANEKKSKQRDMIKARNNGLLVLTDRYPQSNMPGASDGPLLRRYQDQNGLLNRISKWEEKIYKNFSVNAPDLSIKLVVPTEVAMARKPEMTFEEIENKKKIVMNMDISDRVAVIDTNQPFEISRGEVMKEIWNLI